MCSSTHPAQPLAVFVCVSLCVSVCACACECVCVRTHKDKPCKVGTFWNFLDTFERHDIVGQPQVFMHSVMISGSGKQSYIYSICIIFY